MLSASDGFLGLNSPMRFRFNWAHLTGRCWLVEKGGEFGDGLFLCLKKLFSSIWVFPKIGVPQNGWFITENPIKMDDLGDTTPYFWIHPYTFFCILHWIISWCARGCISKYLYCI